MQGRGSVASLGTALRTPRRTSEGVWGVWVGCGGVEGGGSSTSVWEGFLHLKENK